MLKSQQITEATQAIAEWAPAVPKVAVVLGSGLGNFAKSLDRIDTISYSRIPHFPQPSVAGHAGELVFGYLGDTPVLAAKGRLHYYEGHPIEVVQLPIRLFAGIGTRNVIVTNAAGCVNPDWQIGDLMLITGHMDYSFLDGPEDPEVVEGKAYHSRQLLDIARQAVADMDMRFREGIYAWSQGPAYETPEEIVEIRRLGGSAVGMSTVPELRAAAEEQLNVLGISCLTNFAAGILDQSLNHEEVMEVGRLVRNTFSRLLIGIIDRLPND